MRFRKLRIAWSVVWGLATVLLIVLWVRSLWEIDIYGNQLSDVNGFTLLSRNGAVYCAIGRSMMDLEITWRFISAWIDVAAARTVAVAQWERDAINLEIARQRNYQLQLNGEDELLWETGSHNPEWDLIRKDEVDRLNARLKRVDNFLSAH